MGQHSILTLWASPRHLDAEALGLQVGQGDVLVIASRLSNQVEVLTQVLLQVLLCGWVNHGCLYICNDTTRPGTAELGPLPAQSCRTLVPTTERGRLLPCL